MTFRGVVTTKEMEKLYTAIRFAVADLKEKHDVISDFTDCKFMYLTSLVTFKKILKFIFSKELGQVIRVIASNRVISKQILNLTLNRPGHKPIYVSTLEDAKNKLDNSASLESLRFDLHEKPVVMTSKSVQHDGFILDLSTSDCAITSKTAIPNHGDEIQVRFKLNGETQPELFDFSAKVVRVESFSFNVQFLNVNSAQRSLLWGCLVVESQGDYIPN